MIPSRLSHCRDLEWRLRQTLDSNWQSSVLKFGNEKVLSKLILIDEPGTRPLMFSISTNNQHKTTSIGETWSHYFTNWRLPLAANVTLNPFTSSSTFTRYTVPTLHSKLDNRTPTEPGTVSLSGDLKWVVPLVSVIPNPRRWTKRKFI